jgi:hypothetical protein
VRFTEFDADEILEMRASAPEPDGVGEELREAKLPAVLGNEFGIRSLQPKDGFFFFASGLSKQS